MYHCNHNFDKLRDQWSEVSSVLFLMSAVTFHEQLCSGIHP